jgi:hypothetical protein
MRKQVPARGYEKVPRLRDTGGDIRWLVLSSDGWYYLQNGWYYLQMVGIIFRWLVLSSDGWYYLQMVGIIFRTVGIIFRWLVLSSDGWYYLQDGAHFICGGLQLYWSTLSVNLLQWQKLLLCS